MRGKVRRNPWLRPLSAAVIALLLLIVALYALDRAGAHMNGDDVRGALAVAILAGVIVAAVEE